MTDEESNLAARVFDALPQAVLVLDGEGRLLWCNPAAVAFFHDPHEALRLLPVADMPSLLRQLAQADQLQYPSLSVPASQGRELLSDWTLCLLDSNDGPRVLVVVEDVTERAAMERRRSAEQRLGAQSEMGGRLAHELNNPLDAALRLVGLARRSVDGPAGEYLDKAQSALLRMAQIIRTMAEAASESRAAWRPLRELLDEAEEAMQPTAAAARVVVDRQTGPDDNCLAPPQLFQVFCNLIRNAVEAMRRGGRLSIRVRRESGSCQIDFHDTGPGLGDKLERAFEPFFTTKPPGRNLGLGLSVCRELLKGLGGSISAQDAPSGGAVFTVRVPAAGEQPVSPRSRA